MGVNTVEHVKAMADSLSVQLTRQDIDAIHEVSELEPLFPIPFIFNFRRNQKYDLTMTTAKSQQYQMGAWIDAPPKQPVSSQSIVKQDDLLTSVSLINLG